MCNSPEQNLGTFEERAGGKDETDGGERRRRLRGRPRARAWLDGQTHPLIDPVGRRGLLLGVSHLWGGALPTWLSGVGPPAAAAVVRQLTPTAKLLTDQSIPAFCEGTDFVGEGIKKCNGRT